MEASQGTQVDLPDINTISPYLGLFTLVTINPAKVDGCSIFTPHLPTLSIIRGNRFIKAPSSTSPAAKKAARIFQPLLLDDNAPKSLGMIPLSSQDETFTERRYWRLPVPAAAIFAALIERLTYDSSKCDDIVLARNIRDILSLQSRNAYPPDHDTGGEPSGGGGSGLGGGGRPQSKRKDVGDKSSSRSGKKKARKSSGGSDRIGKASRELIHPFQLPLEPHHVS